MQTFRSLLLLALCTTAAPLSAQTPGPSTPPTAPREPPSNEQAGVSIDRYIGAADRAPSRISHDVMFTRSILRAGDPQQPGAPGAVLLYNKEIVLATLPAHNATPLAPGADQLVVYVEKGAGTLDDGKLVWDLKPGIAVLIPPNQAHRFTNGGDSSLQMLLLSRTLESTVTPRKDILVRDVATLAMTERNVHWSHMAKYVFLGPDGLYPADRVFIVYMGPMSIGGAHAHTPGQEEAWVKISDGPALMQLGSEIRPWPANSGFVAPPNGQTVHAAINIGDETQAWFYFARLQPNAPPPGATPPPPRPVNPAIAEALLRATIAGRPLSPAERTKR